MDITDNTMYINSSSTVSTITTGNSNIYATSSSDNTISTTGFTNTIIASDVITNGSSINERLRVIEERLQIPTRDITLENKYQPLARLWKEYEDTLHSLRNWELIKESK